MVDTSGQRRLAAILAADVAGYTRLVEEDTDGTVAAWKTARDDVIKPLVENEHGHIIKFTGDGFLVEFPSVQDAVTCAIAMQDALASNPLNFRIGINLGDITDDGGDIHGEGVNIAARLEAMSEPGGICISGDVHTQVRNRITAEFIDRGEHEVKHVTYPVRVYTINSGIPDAAIPAINSESTQPRKISLVFDGLELKAGDDDAGLLCDGVSEAIRAALANRTNISLITDADTADMLVEGSIQARGTRYRAVIRLVDRKKRELIKSEKFDGIIADLFEAEDDLALRICTSIRFATFAYEASALGKTDLPMAEQESSVIRDHVGGLLADLHYEEWLEARRLLEVVLDRNPDDPSGLAMAGMACAIETYCGWRSSTVQDRKQAVRYLRMAVRLNPSSDFAHAILSLALLELAEDHTGALFTAEQLLKIAPHYAQGQMAQSAVMIYSGRVEEGVDLALRAIEPLKGLRLFSQNAPYLMLGLLLSRRHDEVLVWGQMVNQRMENVPRNLLLMASAAAHLQDYDLAREYATCLLERHPDFSLAELRIWPLKRAGDWDHFTEGLRAAGLPKE